MHSLSQALLEWLSQYHFYVTVMAPLAALIYCNVRLKEFYILKDFSWLTLSIPLSYMFSYWKDDNSALIISPVCMVIVVVSAYFKKSWTLTQAFTLSYTTLLTVDLTMAYKMHYPEDGWAFLTGIGGAGWQDGLVIFPLVTLFFVVYINSRRKGKLDLTLI